MKCRLTFKFEDQFERRTFQIVLVYTQEVEYCSEFYKISVLSPSFHNRRGIHLEE